ncbi:phosphatidate cytidylyltransferase [Gemmobacter serpentinus]|uniref:phosphatidate cytidylyltransferase n=1 Tax=Gemmobacter serpentinus TaxID=2652247 RepID=UPI00124F53B9|nr:phosphatidate cytidylyltransferase [Gemmobacter serpentinus]
MSGGSWTDLMPRVVSAAVMVVIGGAAIWLGGVPFAALVILAVGAMAWELARMTAGPGTVPATVIGLLAAVAMAGLVTIPGYARLALLLVPALVGSFGNRRDPGLYVAYALLIMLTGIGLVLLRELGIVMILWIVTVVVTSDVLGYFAGRSLGGPKFWPAISPKKTWSGTVAGWIGAALIGTGFFLAGYGGISLIWISVLVAFAGQLGDIAESAIKRRAGVKDASNLLPGHGGVMDRFDALSFAVVLVMILLFILLPQGFVGG